MIKEIEINRITLGRNVRTKPNADISELMQSIKRQGLLQPIGVTKKNNKFIIIWGNRRLQAVMKLGWKKITANIVEGDLTEEEFVMTNVVENIHRKDISPIELAKVVHFLKTQKDMTLQEVAVKLSTPLSKIKTSLNLNYRIPKEFRDEIGFIPARTNKVGKISVAVAQTILSLRVNKKQTISLMKYAKKHGIAQDKIKMIGSLIHQGFTIEEAVKESKKYLLKNVKIPVKKNELSKLHSIHKSSFQNIIVGILTGDIEPNKSAFHITSGKDGVKK